MVSYNICRGHVLRIAAGITMLVLLLVGSVSAAPSVSSCGTISSPGEYVLNMNLTSSSTCILINSSNVIFDGAGYSINGTGISKTYGVYVNDGYADYMSNITVKTLKVTNWDTGINLVFVEKSTVIGIIALNNNFGIRTEQEGGYNTFSDNNVSNNNYGIGLEEANSDVVSGNIANNNENGIVIYGVWGNIINNNTVLNNNGVGISSYWSGDTISGNTVSNNGYGIYAEGASTINGNNISSNKNGIYLGILSGNSIYNNYFNNTNNSYIDVSYPRTSNWNISKISGTNIIGGSYLGGNFWANPNGTGFSQTCTNTNGDGICDSPFVLDSYNIDYLPLTSINTILPSTRYINGTVKDSITKNAMSNVKVSANSTLSTTTSATGFYCSYRWHIQPCINDK